MLERTAAPLSWRYQTKPLRVFRARTSASADQRLGVGVKTDQSEHVFAAELRELRIHRVAAESISDYRRTLLLHGRSQKAEPPRGEAPGNVVNVPVDPRPAHRR